MKSVVVTGARGFLGSECLSQLVEQGFVVHAVSSQCVESSRDVYWHQANLLDAGEATRIMSQVRPSHLLHLAWETTPGKYWTSPANIRWLEASIELLREFQAAGGLRVVSAGTCAEYDWDYGYCRERITPLRPRSLYGTSKLALSQVIESWAPEIGISAAVARIFFMYGPGSHRSRFPGPVISALNDGAPADCSHGRQIRDFLYVSDAAQAITMLLESDVGGPVNIGSGQPLALREIVEIVAERIGGQELLRWGAVPTASNDPPLVVADTTRLKEEIGWQPKVDLGTGLQNAIDWHINNQHHAA